MKHIFDKQSVSMYIRQGLTVAACALTAILLAACMLYGERRPLVVAAFLLALVACALACARLAADVKRTR